MRSVKNPISSEAPMIVTSLAKMCKLMCAVVEHVERKSKTKKKTTVFYVVLKNVDDTCTKSTVLLEVWHVSTGAV